MINKLQIIETIEEANKVGVLIYPRGSRIGLVGTPSVIKRFQPFVSEHKKEFVDFFNAQTNRLTPKERALVYLAFQFIEGEFDGGDKCTLQAIYDEIRVVNHWACGQAAVALSAMIKKGKNK